MPYIFVLHQTTTTRAFHQYVPYCLISLFYIKPQPIPKYVVNRFYCLISLFYIKPQPTVNVLSGYLDCLISLFYIKPQRSVRFFIATTNCLISLFYIKPQLIALISFRLLYCLISLFYIKPQQEKDYMYSMDNCLISLFYIKPQLACESSRIFMIALYLCSTSNHNSLQVNASIILLPYIFVLHQTTTYTLYFTSLQAFAIHSTYTKWSELTF